MKYRLTSTIEDGETVLRVITNARYSEGDVVDTPDGLGIVVEVRTEDFDGPQGGNVSASEDSPTYVVGLEDEDVAVGTYKASDLSADELPETDVEDPVEDIESEAENIAANLAPGEELAINDWSPPESWREADTPARLIALDAWSSMGGQFDCGGACCHGTMAPKLGNRGANEFCASFKDFILGGWEGWRRGG